MTKALFIRALPIICLLISPLWLVAQQTITYYYDPSYQHYDVQTEIFHLNAELNIKPYDTLVEGTAEFRFRTLQTRVDSLVFNASELKFSKIAVNGIPATWKMKNEDVIVQLPVRLKIRENHSITFHYTAKPTDGLYFIGWNDPRQIKRKQIWAHRPNHWLPYAPAILTMEMKFTVPSDLKVFANGIRVKVSKNNNNTSTWHYRMERPHPFFSTCVVIGNYDYKTLRTSRGLPLELWYYPDQHHHFEPTYRYQTEMFDFFEKEFDYKYPYELYRQAPVSDYMYGAMETTTATVFGDYLMVDQRGYLGRNYVNVNAHELAHQWFGNCVSHLKPLDVWLTESFATYWAKKFEQSVFGDDYYQWERHKELQDTYTAAKRNNYPVGHSAGGRERWYPKGSLVLDMLRDLLGDEEFRLVISHYLNQFAYQSVETYDFLQVIRKVTGRSLEWFFEQWIYRGGEPHFSVTRENLYHSDHSKELRITVEQIQPQNELIGLFKVPVTIQIYFTDNTTDKISRWIEKKTEIISYTVPAEKEVEFVIFDPNRKIIKQLTFPRSFEELKAQAFKASNMIDRYDALVALREFPLEQKKSLLIEIFSKENFHLPRTEALRQLNDITDAEIQQVFIRAIHDPDDKVRLAVAEIVKVVPEPLRVHYEKLLNDEAYLTIELALENLCRSFPNYCANFLERTSNETGWRGRNIRIKWLEIAIEQGSREYIDELKKYSSASYDFETRINAMNTLRKLNVFDEETAEYMIDGLFHWNFKIRNAARENLSWFCKQNYGKRIIQNVVTAGKFTSEQSAKILSLCSD